MESRTKRTLIAIGASIALLAGGAVFAAPPFEGAEYCAECHPGQYNDWKVSGHPYKLRNGDVAQFAPLPLPEGYTWDDISYVIGGYKWKSRYMDRDGFIITSVRTPDGEVPGHNQYNMMTGRWVDYHAGEEKPYDCGRCHTTGYSPEGHQDGLPGIIGTWEFGGIQCEECHGPGDEMSVDTSAAACGRCHSRGEFDTIPAKGGFIRHHEQYNEMLASPHSWANCVTCHDPHKKAEFSIERTCEDCHDDIAAAYAPTRMAGVGVDCIDCHMPYASKSAEALGPNTGDVRTHLFRIETDPAYRMFTEDGAFVNLDPSGQGAVTIDFACMGCHRNVDRDTLAREAENFHDKPLRVIRAVAR
ncbi:MAG: hypothetical protein D6738_08175 [Acidobacteria bacterium]|nr:MAG: hypothetical protein D6738_08175 [Acidobacteriota bacterium]